MAIIGGGPIGCEMAQAFARFGTEVHLFHRGDHLLEKEDADAAAVVQAAMARDGVGLHLSTSPRRISVDGPDKTVHWQADGASRSRPVDEILVSAGRTPNVEDLGLDAAGVEYDARRGVAVDDRLRTSNPKIYAAGDVCMKYKFTHAADTAARILLRNALFRGRSKLSDLVVPWVTYTSPEIGHVGLYPQEARERGIGITTFRRDLAEVDRAVCDGETEGFVKLHVREGTDRILGATVVAEHAGGMMGELSAAIALKQGLGSLAGVIHPYPTQAEAVRQAGDAYNRTRLTPLVAGLMRRWLRWTR
jgi:pyruvate/2-oxoglutarate dehydrogenase complex dihydrolipoamide dehydrogenase (E3) component